MRGSKTLTFLYTFSTLQPPPLHTNTKGGHGTFITCVVFFFLLFKIGISSIKSPPQFALEY